MQTNFRVNQTSASIEMVPTAHLDIYVYHKLTQIFAPFGTILSNQPS